MVRMARDIKQFVRDHGYKMWIHKILQERGYKLDIPWRAAQKEVQAYVYRDAWMVYCPNCAGAILVDDKEPFMFCPDCHNADNDGVPYRVIFKNKDEVDALLSKRKNPQNRNWLPGETVEDLMLEQELHGEL